MITIALNRLDIDRLCRYIENVTQSGHYGNGQFRTPVEDRLINMLRNSDDYLKLDLQDYSLLLEFIFDATGNGIAMVQDEEELIKKFYNAIQKFEEDVSLDYRERMKDIGTIKDTLHKAFPHIKPQEKDGNTPVYDEQALDKKISEISEKVSLRPFKNTTIILSDKFDTDEKKRQKSDPMKKSEKEILKDIIKKTKGRRIF